MTLVGAILGAPVVGREIGGTLPAVGGALAGSLVLFLLLRWAIITLTPARQPDSSYWPLQFSLEGMGLVLTVALLGLGWHYTRTRGL